MPPTSNGSSIRERAAAAPDAQDGLFDHQWTDEDLLAALEEREQIKERRRVVNGEYKVADDAVKHELERFSLAPGEVARIGRFKIKKTQTAERHVEFDAGASNRLSITTVD